MSVCVGGSVRVCMSVCHLCAGIHIDQKRASDTLELGYRPLSALSAQCLYWELNSDLLQEQLISEPFFPASILQILTKLIVEIFPSG